MASQKNGRLYTDYRILESQENDKLNIEIKERRHKNGKKEYFLHYVQVKPQYVKDILLITINAHNYLWNGSSWSLVAVTYSKELGENWWVGITQPVNLEILIREDPYEVNK